MQYKLEPKYKDGKLVGYILVIYDMTPDELMDKLAFDEQQRDWAALIADTIADSDYAAPVGSSDNTADENLYDIVFTGRENSQNVVYFSQYDSRWGSQMYGRTNTIAGAGCGPSSLCYLYFHADEQDGHAARGLRVVGQDRPSLRGFGQLSQPDSGRCGALGRTLPRHRSEQKTADSGFAGRETGRGDHESGGISRAAGISSCCALSQAKGKILLRIAPATNAVKREWDINIFSERGATRAPLPVGPFWVLG